MQKISHRKEVEKTMKYEKPIWELIEVQTADVVCVSGKDKGDSDSPWVEV